MRPIRTNRGKSHFFCATEGKSPSIGPPICLTHVNTRKIFTSRLLLLLKDGRTNCKYNAVTRMKLGVKKSINDICMLLSDGLCRGVCWEHVLIVRSVSEPKTRHLHAIKNKTMSWKAQKKSLKELRETAQLGDNSGFKNIKCGFKHQMLHFTTLFHKNVSLRQLKAILCLACC